MTTAKQKNNNKIVWLCAFIYFASYITRINYGAVISEMVTSTGLAKSALSLALTGNFITYGLGQFISGYFGDRIQPRTLVAGGLITSVFMNALIPLCQNTVQTTIIWCINGFAQAFMWPPIVKLMSSVLSPEKYSWSTVRVSWGSSCGTIFIYLISPVIISLVGWRSVFWFCALTGAIGVLIWYKACPKIELNTPVVSGKINSDGKTALITPLVLLIMFAIVLQGIVRDGVTTWMPSYIAETYKLSNEISILTGIVLPIFSILCFQVTERLYAKKLNNPMLCAAAIFGVSSISGLLLYLFSDSNAAFSVFLSALLTGCMHGVNLILVCICPPLLAKEGRVSTMSGLLNACTYVGSALSAYLIPLATELSGSWSTTLLLWFLVVAAGTLICVFCIPNWKKHTSAKTAVNEEA